MSGRPALHSDASAPRIAVVDGDQQHEVFDIVDISDGLIRARSAFLFECGEELNVRIDQGGSVSDAIARVRAHTGPRDAPITELELSDCAPMAAKGR